MFCQPESSEGFLSEAGGMKNTCLAIKILCPVVLCLLSTSSFAIMEDLNTEELTKASYVVVSEGAQNTEDNPNVSDECSIMKGQKAILSPWDRTCNDKTPPTGTITINSGSNYTNSAASTLTLNCTDSEGNCSKMKFRNENRTWSTSKAYSRKKSWKLSAGDGTKTVYVKFKDCAGNWSRVFSDTIVLDTVPPVTTASPAGGMYGAGQSVSLTCNDSGGSDCDKIYYSTDGSTPTKSSSVYSSPINIAPTKTLKFFATDLAGNQEAVKTETYTISPLAITISSPLPSGKVTTPYSQTLTATGGLPPYNWSITSGTLPNGLTLYNSGAVSGTPKKTGTSNFIAQVMDEYTSKATKNFSITIESFPVRISRTPPIYHSVIQDAYDNTALGNGDTIQCQALVFNEDVQCDLDLAVTLEGGYDPDFTSNPNYTTINGSLTITNGTVTVENIIIK